jgi:hypothetical protein
VIEKRDADAIPKLLLAALSDDVTNFEPGLIHAFFSLIASPSNERLPLE